MAIQFGRFMFEADVAPDWLDELDHVNFLQHQRVADQATEMLWGLVGGPPFAAAAPVSLVMIDVHARYFREIRLGDRVQVCTAITNHDHRRLWIRHTLVCKEAEASTVDLIALCFDAGKRRAGLWPDAMCAAFASWGDAPRHL
ncbi:MAG: acyl-CoA thioesterase [Novosphingobium sp.]|uniref:acyl-CoA thioesterase n=1 Tax=Novosphingobium sp. TaxID=1874826 RepID=UPI002733D913|nr:acyl-CoA thioesterase [Novosphingobium sp.]MDP3551814.1 acyl-CoA thioesterase [Novosphingobium sp.]